MIGKQRIDQEFELGTVVKKVQNSKSTKFKFIVDARIIGPS